MTERGGEGREDRLFEGFHGGEGSGAPILLVELDQFSGPMELLLHLVRREDLDILDIPIARITEEFLAVVRALEVEDLDRAGAFLEMAAMLVRIKARMLLPGEEGGDEDEDPRAELVRRLLEYEQIREVVGLLEQAQGERIRRRARGSGELLGRPRLVAGPLDTTWEELFAAALLLRIPEERERIHRVTPRTVAMEEKMTLILEGLELRPELRFAELVAPWGERIHGVMTFLAGLELTRRKLVQMRQVEHFGDLWIRRGDPSMSREDGAFDPAEPDEDDPEPNGEDGAARVEEVEE